MRPLFWKRMFFTPLNANYQRQNFFLMASRAEANQRVLVRKSLHQLHEYNIEQNGLYLEPVTALAEFTKNWDKYTANLSVEEVEDLVKAKDKLVNY